jgi:hypothetical protein
VDLLRFLVDTDFSLKDDTLDSGFHNLSSKIDLKPTDWLSFFFDSSYDLRQDVLTSANFDLYINSEDKWSLSLAKRYHVEVNDELTADFNYKINPKWKFRVFNRFDIDIGTLKEQEYTLTRDLHEWEMDISFDQTRGEGSELWFVFRLKAFPDMRLDFGTSFNRRKPGSQSP